MSTDRARDRSRDKSERVSERVAGKVAGKADQISKKADQIRVNAERHAAKLEQFASRLEAIDVWTRTEPGTRRPRITRDDIAAAAVRIADSEGLTSLSMRRLAAELDVGTMTLYHYVRTKDELFTLVNDYVMGEVVVPVGEPFPEQWVEAMMMVASRSRAVLERHPWLFDITDDPPIGPNSVRHFDQSMQALYSLDVALSKRLEILLAVDEYVFGYCLHARNNAAGSEDPAQMREYIQGLMATGDYPTMSALSAERGFDEVWGDVQATFADETRFERNLRAILDGLARS